jgi:hypothetical protein
MLAMKPVQFVWVAVALCAANGVGAQGIGAGPGATPSKERSVPAESTMAAAKDPKWKAPRTSWGDPSLE